MRDDRRLMDRVSLLETLLAQLIKIELRSADDRSDKAYQIASLSKLAESESRKLRSAVRSE